LWREDEHQTQRAKRDYYGLGVNDGHGSLFRESEEREGEDRGGWFWARESVDCFKKREG
jgi:hypothetical protein